jgi:hypothetical protein
MTATPEALADLFRQLAFISALVGGFAFTFLGVLLASPSRSRIIGWTAGMAMATAAVLTVCVVGWTLVASRVLLSASPESGGTFRLPAALNTTHSHLSQMFILGMFLFLASLGLCGWVRSRALGVVSTVITLLAAAALMSVLSPFLV